LPIDRLLPNPEAYDLIDLVRGISDREMAPCVDAYESTGTYPARVFSVLGSSGLLGLPYSVELGGAGQSSEVYLQVIEELAYRWAAVAVAVSVHCLSCFPLSEFGSPTQQERWLTPLLEGRAIGAYSLSEPQAGSDAAALRCKAAALGSGYLINGSKAWVTNGGKADSYALFARTSTDRTRGISCFHVPCDIDGISFGIPEAKMGLSAVPTTSVYYADVELPFEHRIGSEGQGLPIAFSALDSGRLGIAAVAVGLAQRALDDAMEYANERQTFGRKIIDHQGLAFLLADMAASVNSSRATYLDAARRRDNGYPYTKQASMAKLTATDGAMRVTTDAVQVLGGYGYSQAFPLERYMREAKVLQIFEGTNQIQRLVIARELARADQQPDVSGGMAR
jgi:alkylation response protein AidB-like acyl-CoA dehydrogenase